MPLTFVPHLMPYDQGELVSCYVRISEPLDPARDALPVRGALRRRAASSR